LKQINNNYCSSYYLTEEGLIYNADTKKYIAANNKEHFFVLKTTDNKRKKVALKTLYELVYNTQYCIDNIEDLEGEIWKEIEGTNKKYYVSNLGRVKSYANYEAIILKQTKVTKGYKRVDIMIDKQKYTKLVHRLVAAAFLLPPKNIDMQIHHIDFNINNNAAANLIWLEPKEHKELHNKRRKEQELNG
jgi:hypothetical protein